MIITLTIDLNDEQKLQETISYLKGHVTERIQEPEDGKPDDSRRTSLYDTLETIEKSLILQAMRMTSFRRAPAAVLLGIPERTLYRRLDYFGIEKSSRNTVAEE